MCPRQMSQGEGVHKGIWKKSEVSAPKEEGGTLKEEKEKTESHQVKGLIGRIPPGQTYALRTFFWCLVGQGARAARVTRCVVTLWGERGGQGATSIL